MEQFSLEKHWDDFMSGDFYVSCATEILANQFMKYCHDKGLKWSTGDSLLVKNYWEVDNGKGIAIQTSSWHDV